MADLEELAERALARPVIEPAPPEHLRARAESIRRHRRRARRGAAAAVTVLVAGLAAALSLASHPARSQKVITTSPSPSPSPPSRSSLPVTAPAPSSSWPTSSIQLRGYTSDLVAGPGVIYAKVDTSPSGATPPVLAAVDPATGAARYVSDLGGTPDSIAYGTSLWLTVESGCPPKDHTGTCHVQLQQRDPATLALLRSVDLGTIGDYPATVTTAAGSPVWVAAGSRLLAFNPNSLAEASISLPLSSVWSLSIDPSGRYLYDAGPEGPDGGAVVQQRNVGTGKLVATTTIPAAASGAQISATADGVWASFGTGMQSGAAKLSSAGLKDQVPANGQLFSGDPVGNPVNNWAAPGGGPQTTVSGNALWITPARSTVGLTDVLACADPSNGGIRASDTNPADASLAAQPLIYNSKLYLPGGEGITVIDPPSACQA